MLLDSTDMRILYILVRDARTPFRQIAKELGIGESTVYVRIRKLLDMGILKGFTAIVDLDKLGYGVMAFIEVKVKPQVLGGITGRITGVKGVVEVYEVSGEYPLIAKVVASNNAELSRIIDDIGRIEGVDSLNVRYVLRKISYEASSLEVQRIIKELV
ncbi:MAG: transcriptional regulator [Desulfurococcales archaeon ex4484_204]|nr:MAG: transcriptional regulator [Desulfurococcales archaeon ex4484_204]